MADNPLQSAISESLPENDVVGTESSPVDAGTPAAPVETTTQQVEQVKEPPFNEHPRWKEVQAEKEYYKQLALEALKRPIQSIVQQPEVDPYANMSYEEKAAYEKIDQLVDKRVAKRLQEARTPIENELRQTREMQAVMLYDRFKSTHPDVMPNSPEENAIAQLFQQGKTLEEAYAIIKFPEVQRKMVEMQETQKKVKVQQKLATPPEHSQSIPSISGIKSKEKVDFRRQLEEQMRAAGL